MSTISQQSFWQLQLRATYTLACKEIKRILRIWKMSVMPPLINTYLFCIIFGKILGSKIGLVAGISYLEFIVPGLIMNIVVIESFNNVASSMVIEKYHHAIDDISMSPMHSLAILIGYCAGGIFRALISGLVTAVLAFWLAGALIQHPLMFIYTFLVTSIAFSLFGMIVGLHATKFDEMPTILHFILTPLTFFAGTFYDIRNLPSPWQELSWLNPIAYMVDTFRYSTYGVTFHSIYLGLAVITGLALLLFIIAYGLLVTGYGLRK